MSRHSDNNLSFDFEYRCALCQAIESWTDNAEANNPAAFKYRGANLKYAVECHLYYLFVNSEFLYSFFTQCMHEKLPETIVFSTKLERDLALFLCKKNLPPSRLKVHSLASLHRLRSWTEHWASYLLRQLHPSHELDTKESNIFIHVIHEKFVRYLQPITDCLPVPFNYLVYPSRKSLKPFLSQQGIPFIDYAGLGDLSTIHNPGKVLANFLPIIRYYDRLYASLSQLRPKCMLLVEGNSPQDEIINQVCLQLSIPVVCLQQGWSPIIHNGFRNMSYSKMLVWGKGFAELLQPYNPKQKFIVTGSHVISSELQVSQLSQAVDRKAISFFLQGPGDRLVTKKGWEELIELIEWVASEFKEVPILVREHPNAPLPRQKCIEILKYSNVRLVPPSDYSLVEVFSISRLSIAIFSTTILESIAAGVLPMVFNVTSMPALYPDIHAAGAGIEVKSLEEAKKTIHRLLTEADVYQQFEPNIKQFQAKYFYQGKNKERIIEEITSLI